MTNDYSSMNEHEPAEPSVIDLLRAALIHGATKAAEEFDAGAEADREDLNGEDPFSPFDLNFSRDELMSLLNGETRQLIQRCVDDVEGNEFLCGVLSAIPYLADNRERGTLDRMLKVLHAEYGDKPVSSIEMAATVMKMAAIDLEELSAVLNAVAGDKWGIDDRRLEKWLKAHAGQEVNGLSLIRSTGIDSRLRPWRVTSIAPVPTPESVNLSDNDLIKIELLGILFDIDQKSGTHLNGATLH